MLPTARLHPYTHSQTRPQAHFSGTRSHSLIHSLTLTNSPTHSRSLDATFISKTDHFHRIFAPQTKPGRRGLNGEISHDGDSESEEWLSSDADDIWSREDRAWHPSSLKGVHVKTGFYTHCKLFAPQFMKHQSHTHMNSNVEAWAEVFL